MHMASIAHRQQHATPLRTSSSCSLRHGRLFGFHASRGQHHSVTTRVATPKLASTEDTKRDVNAIEGPSTDLSGDLRSAAAGKMPVQQQRVQMPHYCHNYLGNPDQCNGSFLRNITVQCTHCTNPPVAAGVALLG